MSIHLKPENRLDKRVFCVRVNHETDSVPNLLNSFLPHNQAVQDLGLLNKAESLLKPLRSYHSRNLLVGYQSMPWRVAEPFVLQLLLNMERGALFLDAPSIKSSFYYPPSCILRDMADAIRRHSFFLSSDVRFVVLIRSGIVECMGKKIAIPQFSEAEKIQLQMELSRYCGVVFLEEASSLVISEGPSLDEAICLRRSFFSVLKEKIGWKEFETFGEMQKIYALENMYLSKYERFIEKDENKRLLEEMFLRYHRS